MPSGIGAGSAILGSVSPKGASMRLSRVGWLASLVISVLASVVLTVVLNLILR